MTRLLAAAVLFATLPLTAAAITIQPYQAVATAGTDSRLDESNSAASADAGDSFFNGATAQGTANAGSLGLGAGASAAVPVRSLDGDFDGVWDSASIGGGASARFRIEDIVFTRDDPTDPRPVDVATLLPIDGTLSAARDLASSGRAVASVGVDYGLGLPGPGSTAIPKAIGSILYGSDGTTLIRSATGIFDGLAGDTFIDGVFETPVFEVPIDVPLVLTVILRAGASAVARDGAPVQAAADFTNTLAFLPGGPVFVLPAGVSVRSASAGIENNRWPGGTVAPIPLPPAAPLLAAALAGLALLGRRR